MKLEKYIAHRHFLKGKIVLIFLTRTDMISFFMIKNILSILLSMNIILGFVPIYCLEMFDLKQEVFVKDLNFIQKTIWENHPGPCNTSDPGFTKDLESNFKLAQERIVLGCDKLN